MCVLRYDPNKVDDYSKKELAELVFSGQVSRKQVDEDGLFRKHRPMLDEELSLMELEERDWTEATRQNTKESFQAYIDKYNPPIIEGITITDGWVENTVYIGRHVDDAIRLKNNLTKVVDDVKEKNDDAAAWAAAETDDTISGYTKYITQYDKQPPLYRGQYVDEAKLRINQIQDESDWTEATDVETIEFYKKYLSKYDVSAPAYRGAHVSEAKEAIERLIPKPEPESPLKLEMEDWAKAVSADNIEEYKSYLSKYEAIGGNYVAQAKAAIERLLEGKAWSEALKSNDIEGFKKYINLYKDKNGKHLAEAELRLNQLEDDLAWMDATQKDNIVAYQVYLSCYDVPSSNYRGRHIEDAKRRISHITSETDEKEWSKACNVNTIEAYKLYLSKYDGEKKLEKGRHTDEAKGRIIALNDEASWSYAIKQNSRDAYQDYINNFPNGIHVKEAEKLIQHLLPPKPNGCLKSLLGLCAIAVMFFFGWQYWHHNWPFGKKEPPTPATLVEIDSLQWAIDNHDIPLLTHYAELDSTKAYYPLALTLNSQDSIGNLNKTLHWLDRVLDPDVNSLHQNIINDIQEFELGLIESHFNAIVSNEQDADRKYLEVYKSYISHFEKLVFHTPRSIRRYTPVEEMAEAQIKDRRKHEELRTSILREWEAQHSRLDTILTTISENAKKAYLK